MIKSMVLHTFEANDPAIALKEIQGQFDEKCTLLANTVGILHCTFDFVESGVVSHICNALPFPIVGGTTIAQATNDTIGTFMLTLMVLTSDDVEFIPACTQGHANDFSDSIERSFLSSSKASALPLKLILAFPPIIEKYSGDSYVDVFDKLSGNVPVFGSFAVEDEIMIYTRNATFYGGECFAEEMVYLLFFGNVNPRFLVSAVSKNANLIEAGTITKAEKNVLHEINGLRTLDFFEQIGFAHEGVLVDGIEFVPFMLSLRGKDGKLTHPFARGFVSFDEQGSGRYRGTMYENATLHISSTSGDDILSASKETTQLINTHENVQAALIYSCIVRHNMLIRSPLLELESVSKTIRPEIPFMVAYSGGEMCPTSMSDSAVENRYHNFSFIVCMF